MQKLNSVKGTKDIFGKTVLEHDYVIKTFRDICVFNNFEKMGENDFSCDPPTDPPDDSETLTFIGQVCEKNHPLNIHKKKSRIKYS